MKPAALRAAVGIKSRIHFNRYYLAPMLERGLSSEYFLGRDDTSVIPARRNHTAAGILPERKISHL